MTRRLILAGGAAIYPANAPPPPPPGPGGPYNPFPQGVEGITPVSLPAIGPAPRIAPDFYDILDDGTSDTQGFLIVYDATFNADGSFTVERDLFGPGDYPHTYAGWPIPGDPTLQPRIAPSEADYAAIAAIHAKR